MLKHKTSKELGITLISLVVTIIVLLLLAGITIQTLSGDNGIINKAGNAKFSTEQVQLETEVQTAYMRFEQQMNNNHDLEHYLKQIEGATVEKLVSDTWYVKKGNSEVTIDLEGEKTTGKKSIWDGKSAECPEIKKENEKWNWYIYTPAQLKFLADFVNNGCKLTGIVDLTDKVTQYDQSEIVMTTSTTIFLMNDLDMGARPDGSNWETTQNNALNWTPIGLKASNIQNLGTFDGKRHSIKGIYIDREGNFAGIFGVSKTVQNLTLKDSYIKGGIGTGGIVGGLGIGKIENCHNKNTKIILREGNYYIAGGIVGQLSQGTEGVFNCTNTGEVIGYGSIVVSNTENSSLGGIVGLAAVGTKVQGCSNTGDITAKKESGGYVGGIVGASNPSNSIENCYNKGTITGNECVGGISGSQAGNNIIKNCYNKGIVKGNQKVGSIAGSIGNNAEYLNLYYLSSLDIKALNGQDNQGNNVKPISNIFNSLEEFLQWLDKK